MLSTSIYPDTVAFSRNPILLSVSTDSLARFSVYDDTVSSQLLYTGHGETAFTVNLSEVIDAVIPDMPLYVDSDSVVESIASLGLKRSIRIQVANDDDTTQHTISVIRGAVSMSTWAELRSLSQDIFGQRFLNPKGNFFITARSESWVIAMGEDEISPLPFIMPPQAFDIVDCHAGARYRVLGTQGDLMLLHPDRLRRWCFDNHGVLPSLFEVQYASAPSARIAITQSPAAPWAPIVRWLDSYGAWSRLRLAAPATLQAAPADDQAAYNQYMSGSDSFSLRRDRSALSMVYSVSTAPMAPHAYALLPDMLASDQVYLYLPGRRREFRVIPSAESYQAADRPTAPQRMTLSFRIVDDESFPTLDRPDSGSVPPRIHTDQFTDIFN